jgi:hypothetical protein
MGGSSPKDHCGLDRGPPANAKNKKYFQSLEVIHKKVIVAVIFLKNLTKGII